MAMLLLPDVIQRTWGDRSRPADGTAPIDVSFWPEAIRAVRGEHPGFLFMAEVYWDLEWDLQQQGFDYTYDKRLYDRLHGRDAAGVRGHLCADAEFQHRSVRFLENHDEPRAAAVAFAIRGQSIAPPRQSLTWCRVFASSMRASSKGAACGYRCIWAAGRAEPGGCRP